ncbi:DNA N-6-adenine-methyltransferase, partial [Acinetobacter baumannii]
MNNMTKNKLFGLAEERTDVWATPQDFFEKLDRVFNFDLDVCALPENAKCERYFTPEIDGLKQEWTGTCWMNPPYGKEIIDWVAKAAETASKGHTV